GRATTASRLTWCRGFFCRTGESRWMTRNSAIWHPRSSTPLASTPRLTWKVARFWRTTSDLPVVYRFYTRQFDRLFHVRFRHEGPHRQTALSAPGRDRQRRRLLEHRRVHRAHSGEGSREV